MGIGGKLLVVFLMCLSSAWGGYAAAESAANFDALRQRLVDDGFEAAVLAEIYRRPGVRFEVEGVSRFFVHSEARIDYDQFASAGSIRSARQYLAEHRPALAAAERRFGVEPQVIAAIIMVESRFGKLIGRRSVLSILSTIAALREATVRDAFLGALASDRRPTRARLDRWVNRKSDWAYTELKALLKYTGREGIDASEILGSYAGAFGISQFMPTSVQAYARDGNGDGRIDLFDHADAIASVASYLKRNGWRPGVTPAQAYKVIYTYNRSRYYVNAILKIRELLKG